MILQIGIPLNHFWGSKSSFREGFTHNSFADVQFWTIKMHGVVYRWRLDGECCWWPCFFKCHLAHEVGKPIVDETNVVGSQRI